MKKAGRSFSLKSNKNAFTIAVVIALLLASVLLVTFYVFDRPAQNPYTTIYLLDSKRKAADYPEYTVANVNSTFSVYVDMENHMGRTLDNAQVLVKITNNTNMMFPLSVNATQTFTGTIKEGETWENIATISLTDPGNYLVAFELWIPNQNSGAPQFSGNFVDLNVQVAP
jgi:uncharacterized membrane protein